MSSSKPPTSFSFPRSRRLTRVAEFVRVRRDGSVLRGKFLTLGVLIVEEAVAFRIGFITSRQLGGAVVRNRVRRRLREIIRRHQHEMRGGVWMVVIAKAQASRATHQELEDEWLRLAKRASILAATWS